MPGLEKFENQIIELRHSQLPEARAPMAGDLRCFDGVFQKLAEGLPTLENFGPLHVAERTGIAKGHDCCNTKAN